MALRLLKLSKSLVRLTPRTALAVIPRRGIVLSENGAVYEKPTRHRLGVLKTFLVSVPFLYLGATAGKEVSAFLEENDIFIPGDDDDD